MKPKKVCRPDPWTLAFGPVGWLMQFATIACAAHLLQRRLAQDEATAVDPSLISATGYLPSTAPATV